MNETIKHWGPWRRQKCISIHHLTNSCNFLSTSLFSWVLYLCHFSALSLAYTVKMWCCSLYWGEWRSCWHTRLWSTAHLSGVWHNELLHSTSRGYSSSRFSPHSSCDSLPVLLTHPLICLPRYLIPCNHMMLSQRRVVRERDFYSASAAKILALTPSCCSPDHSPPPLRQLDSILFSKGSDTPSSSTGMIDGWKEYYLSLIKL